MNKFEHIPVGSCTVMSKLNMSPRGGKGGGHLEPYTVRSKLIKLKGSFILERKRKRKVILFFDLCHCCCCCSINTQIGNNATDHVGSDVGFTFTVI